jgi:thioester reductase-like protein
MSTIFLTGFPGFLAASLLPRILSRAETPKVVCLVQPRYMRLAEERAAQVAQALRLPPGRIELVSGDLTRPDLDLADCRSRFASVTEIFHLAAVYDLSVPRDLALAVNVKGTEHVLEAATSAPHLKRFHYVSTCYVAGKHAGRFREEDLELGQSFHNHYEETKYLAEVAVRSALRQGLPTSIYRPAIVVGDSQTGETQKFDGPYFILRWLLRQPGLAFLPVPEGVEEAKLNVVPRDFVIAAIAALSTLPEATGKTFHLADPNPPSVDEVIRAFADVTQRVIVRLPASIRAAKWFLSNVPGAQWLTGIPPEAVDYFVYRAEFDTAQATPALQSLGIQCPRFLDYLPRLVDYLRKHPEIPAKGLA